MNEEELKANEAYTKWKVYDLNKDEDQEWTWLKEDSLDLVICTVSIDYLIYPLAVLKESYRLLKPGTLPPPTPSPRGSSWVVARRG